MTGAAANALIRYRYEDVTIDPTKRNSILQTWDTADDEVDGKYHSTLEKVISWNAYMGKRGWVLIMRNG